MQHDVAPRDEMVSFGTTAARRSIVQLPSEKFWLTLRLMGNGVNEKGFSTGTFAPPL